ncbi:hypothetical protein OG607_22490 [Streptomyces sp. NBC_01537]|uniref:hypothetical protein n=1 Tax=Streptomyces sp. NBC_01537 TaxID=2903896 RepID=UPI0038654674
MTSTTGTTGTDEHPEVAEISALAEGILPPDRSADVRGHLDDCVLCADVRSSLDEIRSLLGTLPGPPRMPADIAGRIDAALAAEALLDSAPRGADVSRETADPVAAPTSVSRETTPGPDRPSGHSSAPSGPGRPHSRTRRRVAKGLLVTASVTVLGFGGYLFTHSLSMDGGASSTSDAAGSAAAKGHQSLQDRVYELLGAAPAASGEGSMHAFGSGKEPEPYLTNSTSAALPDCVRQGIGRSEDPLAYDHGTYENTDSYLVLLPDTADPAKVDGYVVDASCTKSTPASAGKVLSKDTYAR